MGLAVLAPAGPPRPGNRGRVYFTSGPSRCAHPRADQAGADGHAAFHADDLEINQPPAWSLVSSEAHPQHEMSTYSGVAARTEPDSPIGLPDPRARRRTARRRFRPAAGNSWTKVLYGVILCAGDPMEYCQGRATARSMIQQSERDPAAACPGPPRAAPVPVPESVRSVCPGRWHRLGRFRPHLLAEEITGIHSEVPFHRACDAARVEKMRRGDDSGGVRRIGGSWRSSSISREIAAGVRNVDDDVQVGDPSRDRCQCRVDVSHDLHIGANPFVENSVQDRRCLWFVDG